MPIVQVDTRPGKDKTKGRKLCERCDTWVKNRRIVGTGPPTLIERYCMPCLLKISWARMNIQIDQEFLREVGLTVSWGKSGERPPAVEKKKGKKGGKTDGNDT